MIDPASGTQLELDMPAGMRTKAESTLLIERAADYLRAGPASSASLVASVCQLSAVPSVIADHLAVTLLREHSRFIRTADGGWRLGEPAPPAWRTHAPDEEPLLSSLSFAVVDVETTGGQSHLKDRITEIAIVTVRDGAVQEVYETLVNPERSIPPFVSRLTNITWDMVRDKAPFRGVCEDVLRALEGHVFVAHNAGFDWRFVSTEVARATGRQLTGRRLCTVRLARRVLPQLRRRSLDWIAMHYGVEIPEGQRHRAGGDAIATAHCLIRLLEDAQSHGCTKWSELECFLATGAPGRKRKKKRRGQLAMPHSVSKDTTA
ncbi:MAG: polymerase epsilon subunit [Gemmatimonadetes bacterium]|nr:polymerase epsilon subunit [Gemmatimonadota bacterium]